MRYNLIDSIRGFALILMAVYHFSYDLNEFGILHENMNYDPLWLYFRAVIMTLFLGLVGISFSLNCPSFFDRKFQLRILKIFLCAMLISVATYLLHPQTWIYFGVLHLIVIASILGPWLARFPIFAFVLGIFMIAIPLFYRSFIFNRPFLIVTGLSPLKPDTADFSPLLPWLGVVGLGIFLGWSIKFFQANAFQMHIPLLTKLGRHSLLFYMVHQVILYPIAWLLALI
ncbi:MAG: heparan-alpha-glucosaminide N-acetyltransferase [Bdellovibrionota bacterium]